MEEILTETAENGVIENVHLAPIGRFTGSDGEGNPVEETMDAESLQAIADRLNGEGEEVLADVDHGASKRGPDRNTKAAGWFSRFVVDPVKGLFARLKLTRHGKDLLENREYRYISPTFTLGEDGRPLELHTASLTNTPAFKGSIKPILNQAAEAATPKGIDDMTKEELVDLIKETVKGLEEEKKAENACAEEKAENACPDEKAENAEAAEEKTEEIAEEKTEEKTEVAEEKTEEPVEEKEEPVEEKEEEKEEVIKIEALNSSPKAFSDVSRKTDWMNLHGKEFFDYLAKHPEIRG